MKGPTQSLTPGVEGVFIGMQVLLLKHAQKTHVWLSFDVKIALIAYHVVAV
jgi:hypothetical protein